MAGAQQYPRVALIHDHPPGHPGGGTVLLRRLFEDYPSGQPIYISAVPSPLPSGSGWLSHEYVLPIRRRSRIPGIGRLSLFWNCLPWASYVQKIKQIFQDNHIKAVHAVSHQYLWIPSLWAAKSLGIPYVLAVHDHWPSHVQSVLPRSVSRRLFGYYARQANAILGAHEGAEQLLQGQYGLPMIGVERDGLTHDEMVIRQANPIHPSIAQSDVKVGYCGMYTTYRAEFQRLQAAFRLFKGRTGRNIKLVAAVEFSKDTLIADGWAEHELIYHGWESSYEAVQDMLRQCDILYLPMSYDLTKADMMRWGMSGKTAQYLRAGRPILAHAPSYASNTKLLSEYRIGCHVAEPNAESLSWGLQQLIEDSALLQQIETESLRCIEDLFDLDKVRVMVWNTLSNPGGRLCDGK